MQAASLQLRTCLAVLGRAYPSKTTATTSRWNGPLPQRLHTPGIMKVRPQNGKRAKWCTERAASHHHRERRSCGPAVVPEHRSQPDRLFVTRRQHKRGECAPSTAADRKAAVYTRQPAFPHSTRLPSGERWLLPDALRLQLGRASSAQRKLHAQQIFSRCSQ